MLHSIAVVGIDIHVRHALPRLYQGNDRQHDVVDVAKARGVGGHGVMQPAGNVERDLGSAGEDLLRTVDRRPSDEGSPLIDAGEDRIIPGP